MKRIDIIKKIKESRIFMLKDIWSMGTSNLLWYKKILIKTARTFILAYKGFNEDKVNLRASALTLYSILSVVPLMAMAFGVAKGFGFDEKLQLLLQENLKGQEEIATWIISFSTNMLSSVKGGWIFGIGLIFLFWTVMKVLGNIEDSFNSIWQVKQSRVFFRKFSDYFSIMLVAPIIILVSSSAQVMVIEMVDKITTEVSIIGYVGPVLYFGVKLLPFLLMWLLFTFIYMVMPNTKVKFGSALMAGIIAGTTFQLLQWGYIHFQVGVSKFNAIYGSFAALPLFLVWLNWSWLIVLFGAEISFSAQNHHQYEYETDIKNLSVSNKHLISLYLTHFIVINFKQGNIPFTAQNISEKLKLPVRLVRLLLYDLVECRIIAETPSQEVKELAFIPAMDIHNISVQFVIEKLNNRGHDFDFLHKQEETATVLDGIIKNFNNILQKSESNILLTQLKS